MNRIIGTIAAGTIALSGLAVAAPAMASTPKITCSATAKWNAPYRENDVTVKSNRPSVTAVASADGYSKAWQTNRSGTAVIWLDGPPRGATIATYVAGHFCGNVHD